MRSPPDANRPSTAVAGATFSLTPCSLLRERRASRGGQCAVFSSPNSRLHSLCLYLTSYGCTTFVFLASHGCRPVARASRSNPSGTWGGGVLPVRAGLKPRRVQGSFCRSAVARLLPLASGLLPAPLFPCAPPPTAVPPARLGVTLSVHLLYSPRGVAQISTRGAGFLHFHPALPAFG